MRKLYHQERLQLLDDLDSLPYEVMDRLFRHGLDALFSSLPPVEALEPVPVQDLGSTPLLDQARRVGAKELRAGRVALVTLAGGQGTRLGFEGPKGTYPIEPESGRSFFQMIAEAVRETSQRVAHPIVWCIMTSEATHEQTRLYFESHGRFGLEPGQLRLFRQGMLPAVDLQGRLLLANWNRLAMSPDGHGGMVEALARSGHLASMQAEGIRHLSISQVDNPLVRWFDEPYLGLHVLQGAEVSCKVISKRDDREGLGNLCVHEGRTMCIEYSDFPEGHATARNADGSRRFDAGNISIYIMAVDLLTRLVEEGLSLPIHLARKKVPAIDLATGELEVPEEPNAFKMERFLFDVLPHARRVSVMKTRREEEFAPVKTLVGPDSVESCRKALMRRM